MHRLHFSKRLSSFSPASRAKIQVASSTLGKIPNSAADSQGASAEQRISSGAAELRAAAAAERRSGVQQQQQLSS